MLVSNCGESGMKKDVCSKDDGGFVARIIGGEVEMHRLVHFDKFFSNFFCLESHVDKQKSKATNN